MFNKDPWWEIEEMVEGKTILTLSANDFGMVIRFTDGTALSYINGILRYVDDGCEIFM